MEALTVLYDESCAFCVRCAAWLRTQESYFPIHTLPAGSEEARARYGSLRRARKQELVAVDDAGGVYREADAWLLCLFALVEYREWSLRLANPTLRPLARSAFELLSSNRRRLSEWLIQFNDEALASGLERELGDAAQPRCAKGEGCEVPG